MDNSRFTGRGIAALAGAALAVAVLVERPWLHTGSTCAERKADLPGDRFIAQPRLTATRATSIAAPPTAVWPWLQQMGHGRAGWYGYDLWDNAGMESAGAIVSELQHLAVGDVIADAVGPFGFRVVEVAPGHAVVFRATIHPVTGKVVDPIRQPRSPFMDFTWAFVLTPDGAGGSRLVVRVRYDRSTHWWVAAGVHVYELVDAVFTRKMLAGIRQRAELGPVTSPTAAEVPDRPTAAPTTPASG